MGTRGMGKGWACGVAALVALAVLLVVALDGVALAGKPQPPPSGKLIYYRVASPTYTAWRMASDGSGKTLLPGTIGFCMSRLHYGDSYYYVSWPASTPQSTPWKHPDGDIRYCLKVYPIEVAGDPISILDSKYWKPLSAAFRPGSPPRVTFSAVHWTSDDPLTAVAGLYELTLTTVNADGTGAITGVVPGDPGLLIGCRVFTDTWAQTPELWGHDWNNEYTLAYGNDMTNPLGGQLYWGDVRYPASHVALIASGQPRAGLWPCVNPSGTRVTYSGKDGGYGGYYEVPVTGNATPTLWVAATKAYRLSGFDYLDDDTVVYGWAAKDTSVGTGDIYRKVRGGRATNLTADTAVNCTPIAAREP